MRKKQLIIGIAIGVLARPVVVNLYQPFRHKVRTKLYNLALDFVHNVDHS